MKEGALTSNGGQTSARNTHTGSSVWTAPAAPPSPHTHMHTHTCTHTHVHAHTRIHTHTHTHTHTQRTHTAHTHIAGVFALSHAPREGLINSLFDKFTARRSTGHIYVHIYTHTQRARRGTYTHIHSAHDGRGKKASARTFQHFNAHTRCCDAGRGSARGREGHTHHRPPPFSRAR
jgi:hypothetical protein